MDVSEYVQDGDDVAEYRLKDDNYPEDDDKKQLPIRRKPVYQVPPDQLGLLEDGREPLEKPNR